MRELGIDEAQEDRLVHVLEEASRNLQDRISRIRFAGAEAAVAYVTAYWRECAALTEVLTPDQRRAWDILNGRG